MYVTLYYVCNPPPRVRDETMGICGKELFKIIVIEKISCELVSQIIHTWKEVVRVKLTSQNLRHVKVRTGGTIEFSLSENLPS